MTPKNILSTALSVPIYSTSGVIALFGILFMIPGSIFILGALCLCWLADKVLAATGPHYPSDTPIEEYESAGMYDWREDSGYEREPCQIWKDFYGDDDDAD
jgi:hypothetical protein